MFVTEDVLQGFIKESKQIFDPNIHRFTDNVLKKLIMKKTSRNFGPNNDIGVIRRYTNMIAKKIIEGELPSMHVPKNTKVYHVTKSKFPDKIKELIPKARKNVLDETVEKYRRIYFTTGSPTSIYDKRKVLSISPKELKKGKITPDPFDYGWVADSRAHLIAKEKMKGGWKKDMPMSYVYIGDKPLKVKK